MKNLFLFLLFPLQIIFSQSEFEFTRLPIDLIEKGLLIDGCKDEKNDYATNKKCAIETLENKVIEALTSSNLKTKHTGLTIGFNYYISLEGKVEFIDSTIKRKNKTITNPSIIQDINNEIIKALKLAPVFEPGFKGDIFFDATGNITNIQV